MARLASNWQISDPVALQRLNAAQRVLDRIPPDLAASLPKQRRRGAGKGYAWWLTANSKSTLNDVVLRPRDVNPDPDLELGQFPLRPLTDWYFQSEGLDSQVSVSAALTLAFAAAGINRDRQGILKTAKAGVLSDWRVADEWACALGVSPVLIWPGLWESVATSLIDREEIATLLEVKQSSLTSCLSRARRATAEDYGGIYGGIPEPIVYIPKGSILYLRGPVLRWIEEVKERRAQSVFRFANQGKAA